jgi:hypothetical protein
MSDTLCVNPALQRFDVSLASVTRTVIVGKRSC